MAHTGKFPFVAHSHKSESAGTYLRRGSTPVLFRDVCSHHFFSPSDAIHLVSDSFHTQISVSRVSFAPIDAVTHWGHQWRFSFGVGPEKSAAMAFGPARSRPSCAVSLSGHLLEVVPSYRYLGVVLTPSLRRDACRPHSRAWPSIFCIKYLVSPIRRLTCFLFRTSCPRGCASGTRALRYALDHMVYNSTVDPGLAQWRGMVMTRVLVDEQPGTEVMCLSLRSVPAHSGTLFTVWRSAQRSRIPFSMVCSSPSCSRRSCRVG